MEPKKPCEDCPFLQVAEDLCREVEEAVPFLYAPPRLKACHNHRVIEAGRDRIVGQVHRFRQLLLVYRIKGYPEGSSS